MKKKTKLISALLSMAMVFGTAAIAPIGASAATAQSQQVAASVISVTAEDINTLGTYPAIQQALSQAAETGTAAAPAKVVVEPGSYTLYQALCVYSNTHLTLTGVTLKRGRSGINMLRTGSDDGISSGVTGYAHSNITVEGGTFDGDNMSSTIIKLVHGKNITMRYVAVKNEKNGHMMEVAGVDGLNLRGCAFTHQAMDKNADGYEAVQIDVLKAVDPKTNVGHIVGARSEDLAVKNVLVESCVFSDCPRGIGSHTDVLNNPHTNIVIRGNTFNNMGSVAVQTQGWVNSEISMNTINKAPRAIAVYSILEQGQGTYLPGVLANEGKTDRHASDSYQAIKTNITVDSNLINDCGSINDVYAGYEKAAISVIGSTVTSSPSYADKSGSLPKGNYFCDTVTVKNNMIHTKGNGVRVEYGKNINVDGNVVVHQGNSSSQNDYGIVFRNKVSASNIRKNYISKSPVNGIWIDEGCSVSNINNNEIYTTGKYGIGTYTATVTTISNNDIQNPGTKGISLNEGSRLTNTIIGNRVLNAGVQGVHVSANSAAAKVEKNTTVNCGEGIAYTRSAGMVNVGSNYGSSAALSSFTPDTSTVNVPLKGSYRMAKTPNPLNAVTTYSFTVADSKIAKVDSLAGRITGLAVGTTTVTMKSANGKTAKITVNVTKPGTPAPAPVKPGAATVTLANKSNGIRAEWSKVSNAVKYIVYYKKTGASSWSSVTTSNNYYPLLNLTPGTNYSVQVQTVGANNLKGSYSSVKKLTYVPQVKPNVSLSNKSNGIRAEWGKVAGATEYIVYYKLSGANWSSTTTKNNYFAYLGTKSGSLYCVQVQPVFNGAKGMYSKVKSLTFIGQPKLTAAKVSNGVELSWNSIQGANKYQIATKATGESTYRYITVTGTSYVDTAAKSGENVYQIRAMYATQNNGTAYGYWSST